MIENIVYLNGSFLPISQAKVSVMDRGFLQADGIYDVMLIIGSHLVYCEAHLSRLFSNLDSIKIPPPADKTALLDIIKHLIDINAPVEIQSAYIQITRGVFPRRVAYSPCKNPTLFVMLQPTSSSIDDEIKAISVITMKDCRWSLCNIKGVNRLSNTLMSIDTYEEHVQEGLIVSDGMVLEGASSNIFIVEKGRVFTPSLAENILNGVTRQAIIDLVKVDMELIEESISLQRLLAADEVWITSSLRGVIPVTTVDSQPINGGVIGDAIKIIHKRYKNTLRSFK